MNSGCPVGLTRLSALLAWTSRRLAAEVTLSGCPHLKAAAAEVRAAGLITAAAELLAGAAVQ